MQSKRAKQLRLGPVAKYFVEAVKDIPEVQLVVFVDGEGDDRRIWTIIDAQRLDREVSRRVYRLESLANRQGDEEIGFRLINVRWLPNGIEGLHIEECPVLFQRDSDIP